MIVTNISHGFGNQLFQYAAGYAAAKRAGTALRVDPRYFRRAKDRTYELHRLNLTFPKISLVHEARLRLADALPASPLGKIVRGGLGLGAMEVFRERPDMAFEPRLLTAGRHARLIGFWQDEAYFADYADELRREFAFTAPPNEYNRGIIERIKQRPSVCVHVRRGDYVAAANASLPVCSLDYYAAALERMKARVPDARHFVFSDDPEWARANLTLPQGTVYVTGNVGVSDTDDLRLMSHCDHFIIANSTFSWWAAWLARSAEKFVIAPRPWFRPGKGNETIVPGRWERIDRAID